MDYIGYSAPSIVGSIVLAGLWVTPLSVLWFVSLCLARRRSDPARVGIVWVKAVYPVWIIASVGYVIATGLQLWIHAIVDSNIYSGGEATAAYIAQASSHIGITAFFVRCVADILLFIAFVELASGFRLCLSNGSQYLQRRKLLRYTVLGWGLILFIILIGLFGFNHSLIVRQSATIFSEISRNEYLDLVQAQLTATRLEGAIIILFWITSMPMVGLASYAVHRSKEVPGLRSTAVLLLVATILNFIRLLVVMAIYADSWLQSPAITTIRPDMAPREAKYIVDSFFDYVFMFVLLVLLFVLGIRRRNGLWSQPQPGWSFNAAFNSSTLPTGYTAGPAPVPVPTHPPAAGVPVMGTVNGLPAYLAVAQQQQQQQQQQQPQQFQQMYQQPPQGYYYYPPQQPPVQYQQQPGQQMAMAEPKAVSSVDVQQQQQQQQQPMQGNQIQNPHV
ncbi:hypothetical protein MFIFM68171_06307 [Madurella fahalii]|uniref:Uncharacterized protein n=1 Tax=Madurella fahalii TaxID=1157608 RepID=A0ABQ0GEB5_9PEZI